MKKLLILFSLIISLEADAAFMLEYAFNYISDSDNVDNFAFDKLDNRFFFGASLDDQKLYFGFNYLMFSRDVKSNGSTDTLSTTEIGPKIIWFLGDRGSIYISAGWNPFAKGERKRSNTSEDIDGSSLMGALGYQLKLTKRFYLGASINYHSLSISKATDSSNQETTVSNNYTTIYPMIEMSLRFR